MAPQRTEHYSPMCGKPVTDATFNRFGEWCCSEAHADAYVADVRTAKQASAAGAERAGKPRGGCC